MKMRKGFLALITMMVLCVSSAHAEDNGGTPSGFIIFPSFFYTQETGVLSGDGTTYHTNFKVGFLTNFGLYLGMVYSKSFGYGSYTTDSSAYGNSVGFFYGNFSFIASFYLLAYSNESSLTSSINRSEGGGSELSIGMQLPLGAHFSVGPILSFKSITYKKASQNGVITDSNQNQNRFYPYVGVLFYF